MRLMLHTLGAALVLSCGATHAGAEFYLTERVETLPEAGPTRYSVLTCDEWQFTFRRPAAWSIKLDGGAKKVILQSPDYGSSIIVQVQPKNPALKDPIRTNDLRTMIAERFQGAAISETFPCYTSGLRGLAFELHERLANGALAHYRLGLVPFAGGTVEFTLISSAAPLARARQAFGSFLTSFSVTPAPVPATASTSK